MTTPAGETGTEPGTGSGAGDSGADLNAGNPSEPAEGTTGETGTDTAAEIAKWKALARKHEQRSKENSSAAAELAKLQDKDKTELQRATERANKAEAERGEERAERHRLLAAATHGLGPDFVGYLGGGEESEIFERAENLSKFIQAAVNDQLKSELEKYGIQAGGQAPTAAGAASLALGRRPVESLRAGAAPSGNGQSNNPNDLFRGMLGGR